jgi:hypothetical protein
MERLVISKLVSITSFKRKISSCPMPSTILHWHCYTVHRNSQSLSRDLKKKKLRGDPKIGNKKDDYQALRGISGNVVRNSFSIMWHRSFSDKLV